VRARASRGLADGFQGILVGNELRVIATGTAVDAIGDDGVHAGTGVENASVEHASERVLREWREWRPDGARTGVPG
jgi:hypothetical protein